MLASFRNAVGQTGFRSATVVLIVCGLAGLSACHKKTGGQIVAVVDGQEVTQEEMRTEAQSMQVPAGTDPKVANPAILQRIVDRTLLANYAHQAGLDKGPEYVSRRRLLDQTLLADLALQKLAGTSAKPSQADDQEYIAAHPTLFAKRQLLTLDQVRFATPADHAALQVLTKSPSIDAVVKQLDATGIKFTRAPINVNTGNLDPAIARQIVALANGQVFDLSTSGQTFISVITSRSDAATDTSTWPALAASLIQRERAAASLKTSVDKLRSNARIQYDPAFAPKKR